MYPSMTVKISHIFKKCFANSKTGFNYKMKLRIFEVTKGAHPKLCPLGNLGMYL